jgi:hypothetical protein
MSSPVEEQEQATRRTNVQKLSGTARRPVCLERSGNVGKGRREIREVGEGVEQIIPGLIGQWRLNFVLREMGSH